MSALVRFQSVVKVYGSATRLALGDLDFQDGDRVLITGANGSGKSTLLRLLAGASVHSTGTIWRAEHWRRLRLGYVPQSNGLYDDLTMRGNFELRRLLYGNTPALDVTLERLNLAGYLNTRAGDLSGGFRRLLALAAALAVRPDVLIMDEPFEGVDPVRSEAARGLLSEVIPRLALLVTAAPTPDVEVPSLNSHLHIEQGRVAWVQRSPSS